MNRLFAKTGVRDRAQVVAYAFRVALSDSGTITRMPVHSRHRMFYAHLVATAVLQFAVVFALAPSAVDAWVAVTVCASSLGLAAHGYTSLARDPATSPQHRP